MTALHITYNDKSLSVYLNDYGNGTLYYFPCRFCPCLPALFQNAAVMVLMVLFLFVSILPLYNTVAVANFTPSDSIGHAVNSNYVTAIGTRQAERRLKPKPYKMPKLMNYDTCPRTSHASNFTSM